MVIGQPITYVAVHIYMYTVCVLVYYIPYIFMCVCMCTVVYGLAGCDVVPNCSHVLLRQHNERCVPVCVQSGSTVTASDVPDSGG